MFYFYLSFGFESISFDVRFKQLFKSKLFYFYLSFGFESMTFNVRFKQLFKSNIKTHTFKTETEIQIKHLVTH